RHPEFRLPSETALPECALHPVAVGAEAVCVALGEDDSGGVELVTDRHAPGSGVLDHGGPAFLIWQPAREYRQMRSQVLHDDRSDAIDGRRPPSGASR